ncbi:LytR/AlgR family response regulator transcription factor [Alicyclobacillus macrosporangiidus]|uniref:Two-component system, LytT family, response regulator LytT n=1 Tax=Alicyclobacillus macrosporangiidus TaxID=392015 RepID=A0A1I7GZC2_9BACL|nr:LytTR family DNA-binding domain-containing protein [Alicyclobacillus macrosporangiidus]SFU53775.1 two-component system, LytT family, response regulator LytT [Alicyclobacillus macrosporangiidus]
MSIRVLIAEDEWVAREELAYLISRNHDFELCRPARNGPEAYERWRSERPDVVFLDIHMPVCSGMEVARRIAAERPVGGLPLIVFTTAYDEHAVEAFSVEAIDYVMKPYDPVRVQATLNRVRHHWTLARSGGDPADKAASAGVPILQSPAAGNAGTSVSLADGPGRPAGQIRLLLHHGGGMVFIDPTRICYATRVARWVEVHTDDGPVCVRTTLNELGERLAGLPFFRTHKSCLVNLSRVREVRPWVHGAYTVVMDDAQRSEVPVSRNAAKALLRRLRHLAR